ncbi:MAG TPA: response regulator [Steroidobacteraceae bacterium]|nr:response regulator [Steroidobacteraceae bacterium]
MIRNLILNVDDTAGLRYGKTRVLRAAGYEVAEAGTGAEALRLARELQPQLILLDVNLPDMNGIDVCKAIKGDPVTATTPVIQVSATFITESDQQTGLRGGADIYLTEPLEPKVLETVVSVLLQLRHTEAGLRETEQRWRRLVDSNVVGILVVQDQRIVEANELFLSMLGYRLEEVKSLVSFLDITPPEYRDISRRAVDELIERGSCGPFEKEYLHKDGRRINVVVGAALIDRARKRWMTLVLDITAQKRIEADREAAFERERVARAQAEEATRLKDDFLANLSHELRTPMNIIIGWAHLLRKGLLSDEQKVRAAEAIERAARSQAQLIEDLLDVSRIVTGKFRMAMQEVRISGILQSAVESLRLVAASKQVAVTVSQEAPDARVNGDPDRLQQVLLNLLSNAVKFTPSGGCVDVRMHASDDHVHISVTDTGIGISADFLPHVFDRFRQADSTSTRQHTGMGLGLAIVRHVVELHQGTVRAESAGENAGSTFSVSLPLLRTNTSVDASPSDAASFPNLPVLRSRSWKVLLVDDDPDAREVTVEGLAKAGFELRAVATAQEALSALDQWEPDVIVSDIGMPGVDGYEFMRQLRARPAERGGRVPALALTAFARLEDAIRARASGYQGHIAKPVSPEDLASAVARLKGSAAP